MRIGLAQINSTLGDFESNCKKIIEFTKRARERRCDVVVFPEATLFGYHPMDLLKRSSVVAAQTKYIHMIHKSIPEDMAVVFGAFTKNPGPRGKPYFNTAFALVKGQKPWSCHKELLPTYDVFDDARHIEPGDMRNNIFRFKGRKILITVCEDIWAWPSKGQGNKSIYEVNPLKKIRPGAVDFILNLSASPFFTDKLDMRRHVTRETARYLKAPIVYVNMVGAQDELIFDGASFVLDEKGKLLCQCSQFVEDINVIDMKTRVGGFRPLPTTRADSIRQALVLGIRDFVRKTGQRRVHLGLSGGIDSAVVACLAVDALGSDAVEAYALPGPYSTSLSLQLAKKLASHLNIACHVMKISKSYNVVHAELSKSVGVTPFGLMQENLQARLRALFLMAMSNKKQSLLLNTSNKSELASGYGTLYGDLAGGLSPIGDLLKRDIYELAQLYNEEFELIPRKIISRAPTAELRKNQKDQDTLPPYDELDRSVVHLVERASSPKTKSDHYLLPALMKSEFKRWQSPPILKVREYSFGQGRRMPISHKAIY